MTATTESRKVTAEATSRFVETPRYRIHYHDAGKGNTIVLLHGSGPGATGWSNFRANIGTLSENYRVIAVDMPGWGQSDTVPGDQVRDHPQDLIALLDALEIERVAVVGNSMGGATALGTAARFPERISHLITMGASGPGGNLFSPAGSLSEGLRVLMQAYHTPTPAAMKALVSIMCFDQSMATDELSQLRSDAALAHPEHLESFRARLTQPLVDNWNGAGPLIPGITAPALFIHGRDDRVISYEGSLRLTSIIANSRMYLINQCGHWAQIEHAAEFNNVVAGFVAS